MLIEDCAIPQSRHMNEDHHQLHLARTVTEGGRNTHIIHGNEIQQKRNRRELSPRAPTKKFFRGNSRSNVQVDFGFAKIYKKFILSKCIKFKLSIHKKNKFININKQNFTCERNYIQLSKGKKQEFTIQLSVTTRTNISFTST